MMELTKKILVLAEWLLNFLLVKLAYAQDPLERLKGVKDVAGLPETAASPQRIIINIVVYLLGFVGLFFVISIIYGGIVWLTSGGKEENITKAKGRLKNSIIGIVIILTAYSVTWYVGNIMERASVEGHYYGIGARRQYGECVTQADCEDDEWCYEGECLKQCENEEDCANDETCHQLFGGRKVCLPE